jgi:hypothetical protein
VVSGPGLYLRHHQIFNGAKCGTFPVSAFFRERGVTTESEGSVSRWIVDLKAGDGAASRELYFEELVRLARVKLAMTVGQAFDDVRQQRAAGAQRC